MVSFIIRTKNEIADIERTLQAIRNQDTEESIEIVLVDSGSTDGTIEAAEPYVDKIIRIKPEDFTWGFALNLGIENSDGDYICLVSGHCILENERTLEDTLYVMRNHNIVALYGIQKGEAKKDPYECFESLHTFPNREYLESKDGFNIPISNAGCILKRRVWEEIRFDETVQSAEDVIWAREVCNAGYKVGYSNKFSILHGHPYKLEYIYRKWFWRNYWNRKKELENGKSKSYFYILISYLVMRPHRTYKSYLKAKSEGLNVDVKNRQLLAYLAICYLAAYRAVLAVKKNKYADASFNDIDIPTYIRKIEKLLA